jgi:peptide deformylase
LNPKFATGHAQKASELRIRDTRKLDRLGLAAYFHPMIVRPILTAPDPRLQAVSADVETVDAGIRTLIDDMAKSMYEADGIGLAAIQIGVAKRVVVIDLDQKEGKKNPRAFINPKVIWASEETAVFEEGCLSVPEIWDDVERPARIKAEYLDRDGVKQILEADGMLATCLQHEMDHLNGVLFIDHLSRLKRSMAIKKLTKAKKLKESA